MFKGGVTISSHGGKNGIVLPTSQEYANRMGVSRIECWFGGAMG